MSNCLSDWFSRPPLSLSLEEILDALEGLGEYSSPEIAIAFIAVESSVDRLEELFETYQGTAFQVQSAQIADFLFVHHVTRLVQSQSGERSVSGFIATLEAEGATFVLAARGSQETARNFTDFRDHCLMEWIERFYPDVDIKRVASTGLLKFLGEIELQHHHQLQLLRSTIRFPSGGYQRTERQEALEVVLARLEDESAYLDRFTCSVPGEAGYVGSFSRAGPAMYHGGDLRAFLEAYRGLLAESTARGQTIQGLLARETGAYPPAIEIRFACPVALGTPAEGVELVEKLEDRQLYSVSVLHGNPYLHVTVTDLAHGSSYTLFSHGDQAMRLYPGRNADQTSLDHLLTCISDCLSDVSEVSALQTQDADGG